MHRSYTIEEVARQLGVHKSTVRFWMGRGLGVVDDGRPVLIYGEALRAFLSAAEAKRRQRCAAFEMYCLACRAPRAPAAGIIEFIPITPKSGNLRAICPECEGLMHRRATLTAWPLWRAHVEGAGAQAAPHIGESASPCLHCHLDESEAA
jgi:excisionase family DNA binding protein